MNQRITIKSILEKASQQIFDAAQQDLEKTKFNLIVDLGRSKINPDHKYAMQQTILTFKTIQDLQKYICNAMLKYEGMSVNQHRKK